MSSDGLPLPFQLQVLEGDFLDTTKDLTTGEAGGPIVQGIEFDKIGRRVAYWLFEEHPGSAATYGRGSFTSRRVPAEDVLHVFYSRRPGQIRGVTWFHPVLIKLRDLDEMEDATLMKQKVASLLVGGVTHPDGSAGEGAGVGKQAANGDNVEYMEPGTILKRPVGGEVHFTSPPSSADFDPFTRRVCHAVASGLGITYEQLTGDYSQSNFSSSRMSRLEFQSNVHDWRWNMVIPHACDGVWNWFTEAAVVSGKNRERPGAQWTPPPFAMIEPDREGKAYMMNVRAGIQTLPDAIREQGLDPEEHFAEIKDSNEKLDAAGIILDSDPRKTTQVGGPRDQVAQASPAGTTPARGRRLPSMRMDRLKDGTPILTPLGD